MYGTRERYCKNFLPTVEGGELEAIINTHTKLGRRSTLVFFKAKKNSELRGGCCKNTHENKKKRLKLNKL